MIRHRQVLSGYVNRLLSEGRTVFGAAEAEQALDVGHRSFLDAAERLQRKGTLVRPRQGFYVIVPPQYAVWGAPPPAWYIDALMGRENAGYYVGLLKAAELHGATHQAVMEFQVVCGKRLPVIRAGRNLIVFYYRGDMEGALSGVEDRKTDTGSMKISSAALTALDLLRYPQASGGLDSVATVLSELGPEIQPDQLALLSAGVERPVVQRLGYLLDQISGNDDLTGPMLGRLRSEGTVRWTELDRRRAADPDVAADPVMRDAKWRVVVCRLPEPDV